MTTAHAYVTCGECARVIMPNRHLEISSELSRRQVLKLSGLGAGASMLPRLAPTDTQRSERHVFSLIGDCSPVGAVISTVAYGGMPLAMAVSTFPDLRN